MGELLTRSFTPELEVRSEGDGRTIYGIAVPFGKAMRIDAHLTEMFTRGAFKHQLRAANRIKFSREHIPLGGTLIGRATLLREDTAGLYGEFRVSRTPVGDETLELVRDGALTDLSITFREHAAGNRRMRDGTVNRVKADLVEVAVVLEGAYGELATASGVRSHQDSGCSECGCTCNSQVQPRSAAAPNLDQARQILANLPVLPARA